MISSEASTGRDPLSIATAAAIATINPNTMRVTDLSAAVPLPRFFSPVPWRHTTSVNGAVAIVLAAIVLLAAGCGGSSRYSPDATAGCLRATGAAVNQKTDDLDYIAQDAGMGAFDATLPGNRVTVVFERSSGDAGRTRDAYDAFSGPSSSDVLDTKGNAVVVWDKTPTDQERSQVSGCLKWA